jgi:hypothetical protein
VGKKAISLSNIFMFREYEKRLKKTLGGSFFVYPCDPEKEIKYFSVTFSCFYEREKEQRLSSVYSAPSLKASGLTPKSSSKDGDMPPKLQFIHQL